MKKCLLMFALLVTILLLTVLTDKKQRPLPESRLLVSDIGAEINGIEIGDAHDNLID